MDIKNVYYINLESRIDRREHVEKELNKLGWEYKRFNAVKHEYGQIGCTMSHLQILKDAQLNNLDYVVIVEDDITFTNHNLANEKIIKLMDFNFDVLFISGNIQRTNYKITEDIIKVTYCTTTCGYIVKKHYYQTLIDNIEEGLDFLKNNPTNKKRYAIDIYWLNLQRKDNWYHIYPIISYQYDNYSDIEKRHTNYKKILLKDLNDKPRTKLIT